MLFVDGALGLILMALWIFCIVDVILTPDPECRILPKFAWLAIVVLLLDIGAVIWLIAGRPLATTGAAARQRRAGHPSGNALPKREVPPNPDDNEAFLRGLRERAEEQRRKAREQRDNGPS